MSSQLIDGVVIPYPDGRKEHNTRLWRDATDLEIEQAARIEEFEKREWVGLTDEEVLSEAKRFALGLSFPFDGITTPEMFARAIEAKLKEKNT
jgi:hypothetical protein